MDAYATAGSPFFPFDLGVGKGGGIPCFFQAWFEQL